VRKEGYLSDAQLKAELEKCEYCEEKPCRQACPAHCSPADFIMAARAGEKGDYRRAAALILAANPLGGVCGLVCPDSFCMRACVHSAFTTPVNIPAVQATLIRKAIEVGLPAFGRAPANGKTVAVIGGGPAGIGAAAVLAQLGYHIDLYEQGKKPGGMANLIPDFRLDKKVLKSDIGFFLSLGDIALVHERSGDPAELVARHDAVVVCTGLENPIGLEVKGSRAALSWQEFLERHKTLELRGKRVAVIGGGAVAVDCAAVARRGGAHHVELIYRRKWENMPLTGYERDLLLREGIEITTCARVREVVLRAGQVAGLRIEKLLLPPGAEPLPKNFLPDPAEQPHFRRFDLVIAAIGSAAAAPEQNAAGVFYAGDRILGSSTVVESVASGKNAAIEADAWCRRAKAPVIRERAKGYALLAGRELLPVPLETGFFGRRILSPFLISAAPHSDGYKQMRTAYEKGWAGAVMKTAFDHVSIHIPGGYMFVLGASTYGNCDNVSAHPLDRVCHEVERLVLEFPDRLTMASTGGPVTGDDEADRRIWQSNTRKLENAGAMGIEYSLSCPQGGDGTRGDVVSQDAELTAKIIDWVIQDGQADVPKLFKLTAAVTAIRPIVEKIREVFARYPDKKAGITLANSFPALALRKAPGRPWDEGIIVGMSGEGVLPISNFTLARVAGMGMAVSGNGGPMNYRAAANFLALGAETVQFCTIVMKYGYGIIDDLHSGLSFLLQERSLNSVRELIGSALPDPVTPFEMLTTRKMIPAVDAAFCAHCGNCTRCPYQAIVLDKKRIPRFDPSHCVGCSLCAQKCFTGAIAMRERTPEEAAALNETGWLP
jgi:NADPH-dependent glutamate synthase beta subunit-like oxidoreductase/dihydroorotate dehydrogenase